MSPDQKRAEFAEIAMLLVLNYGTRETRKIKDESKLPSATPQRYSRPLTTRPSRVLTSSVLPIMLNGMESLRRRACSAAASSSCSMGGW